MKLINKNFYQNFTTMKIIKKENEFYLVDTNLSQNSQIFDLISKKDLALYAEKYTWFFDKAFKIDSNWDLDSIVKELNNKYSILQHFIYGIA